ncbi:MAG: hypothetical protein HY939_02355 [Gammaproteobacteria bacterium]|nr:hypothetical protein [Gammaproteobacteria bacterium]
MALTNEQQALIDRVFSNLTQETPFVTPHDAELLHESGKLKEFRETMMTQSASLPALQRFTLTNAVLEYQCEHEPTESPLRAQGRLGNELYVNFVRDELQYQKGEFQKPLSDTNQLALNTLNKTLLRGFQTAMEYSTTNAGAAYGANIQQVTKKEDLNTIFGRLVGFKLDGRQDSNSISAINIKFHTDALIAEIEKEPKKKVVVEVKGSSDAELRGAVTQSRQTSDKQELGGFSAKTTWGGKINNLLQKINTTMTMGNAEQVKTTLEGLKQKWQEIADLSRNATGVVAFFNKSARQRRISTAEKAIADINKVLNPPIPTASQSATAGSAVGGTDNKVTSLLEHTQGGHPPVFHAVPPPTPTSSSAPAQPAPSAQATATQAPQQKGDFSTPPRGP